MKNYDQEWSPWERIIKAADKGTGLHLSAKEVAALGMDQAITDCAERISNERVNCECGHPIPNHRYRKGFGHVCPKVSASVS